MDISDFCINDSLELADAEPNKMFDSLVQNAIDFLEKSVGELEKSPKYSVIHFCTAIELFLKARLLAEHWTLIITDINKVKRKKEETILSKFEGGDFHSVGIDRTIERLHGVCEVKVPVKAVEHFNVVRKHRNKLVHFHHPGYSGEQAYADIVPEQWAAWYHLHRLLVEEWREHFEKYDEEIERLHELVHGNRKYLEAKYTELTPLIAEEKDSGIPYSKCSLCGYESARFSEIRELLHSNHCIVCHNENNYLNIECPECKENIIVQDLGEGKCEGCGFTTDLEFLMKELAPEEDPKEDSVIAYCAECQNPEPSAIPFGESKYLCLNCMTLHDFASECNYCHELNAGIDFGASYFLGCVMCSGDSSWEND